jgi:hypothetical protein
MYGLVSKNMGIGETGCQMPDTRFRMPDAGCRLHVTGYKLQGSFSKYQIPNAKIPNT